MKIEKKKKNCPPIAHLPKSNTFISWAFHGDLQSKQGKANETKKKETFLTWEDRLVGSSLYQPSKRRWVFIIGIKVSNKQSFIFVKDNLFFFIIIPSFSHLVGFFIWLQFLLLFK